MKTKSISLLCVMLILCAGVNFTRAQTIKKKSVDKIVSGKLSVKDDEFTGK